jgi:RND family efflux transporter MFP subunit
MNNYKKDIAVKKLLTLIILLTTTPAVWAETDLTDSLPCIIESSESVDLGSSVTGIIQDILKERSASVKKGEVIVKLEADVERKTVDLASLRVSDGSELKSAELAREYAEREKSRNFALYQKNLVSKQAVDKAITEAALAKEKLKQARSNKAQAKQELVVASAQLNQRILRSPISGVITDRYLSIGNRVQNEAILRIEKINPLNVEVVVPADYYNKIVPGDQMKITPSLPGFAEQSATVMITDKVIDAGSNTFRVTLELPNDKELIPAGARCTAKLDPTVLSE